MLFGIAAVVIGGFLVISAEDMSALYPEWMAYSPRWRQIAGCGVVAYGLLQIVLSAVGF